MLTETPEGLALVGGGLSLRGDYRELLPRLAGHRLRAELLVRAASVKSPRVPEAGFTAVDATAGLGEDSLLLAAAGFSVTMCERDPLIAELLADTLARAAGIPELSACVGRMGLFRGDACELLASGIHPDVVYLDPMFPAHKKSGQTGKKLQLFRLLEAPCPDGGKLFEAALGASPQKIVVKRPLKGELLDGRKPGYTLEGRTVRYDVYYLGTKLPAGAGGREPGICKL